MAVDQNSGLGVLGVERCRVCDCVHRDDAVELVAAKVIRCFAFLAERCPGWMKEEDEDEVSLVGTLTLSSLINLENNIPVHG